MTLTVLEEQPAFIIRDKETSWLPAAGIQLIDKLISSETSVHVLVWPAPNHKLEETKTMQELSLLGKPSEQKGFLSYTVTPTKAIEFLKAFSALEEKLSAELCDLPYWSHEIEQVKVLTETENIEYGSGVIGIKRTPAAEAAVKRFV